jgi:CheY-like chemotaxis protein
MPSILLVEDDADQRAMRRLILERAGHTVQEACTPQAAITSARAVLPNCVLMDLRLPNASDGLDLITRLRDLDARLPLVVLSGWAGDLVGTEQAAQVSELLKKPVRSEKLLRTISRLVTATAMLLLTAGLSLHAQEMRFDSSGRGEVIAQLELSSAESDWA